MKSNIIDINGTKVIVCGANGRKLPESDIQALREFIEYRKKRSLARKSKKKIEFNSMPTRNDDPIYGKESVCGEIIKTEGGEK